MSGRHAVAVAQPVTPARYPFSAVVGQDRLKLALRENLKRRKSQARGREDVASEPADGSLDHGAPDHAGGNEPGR